MAWRPPRRLYVLGKWVDVRQVSQQELQDRFADEPGEELWGAWDDATGTIYLLHTMSPAKKNRKFWHEVAHMLVDAFDPE